VEDVGVREELRERPPLDELLAGETLRAVERPVGFGVKLVALEDDERRVDSLASEGLDLLPRDAGGVDRAVDDAERPGLSILCHALGAVASPTRDTFRTRLEVGGGESRSWRTQVKAPGPA